MNARVRKKASDVFRETEFLLAEKVPFSKAFPQIKDIVIEITESNGFQKSERRYQKSNFPGEYVDCSNTLCYNGGIQIGSMVRDMVLANKTVSKISRSCQGYEGSPKGRRRYRPCIHFFWVEITIEYY